MTDTRYDGFANYPTWCVSLWLNNDEYMQDAHLTTVRENYESAMETEAGDDGAKRYARSLAADALKDFVEDLLDNNADMGSDLQSWALGQVDWMELVENALED